MHQDTIEKLREKISELKKELEIVTFEKGLAADDNKDLRENSAYDYWDQKESILIIRIHKIMKEIAGLAPKKKVSVAKPRNKKPQPKKAFEITPHKWL